MYLQVQKKASDVAPHALLSACHGPKDEDPPWKTEHYHGLHYHIHAVPRRGRHRYRLISFHLLPFFLNHLQARLRNKINMDSTMVCFSMVISTPSQPTRYSICFMKLSYSQLLPPTLFLYYYYAIILILFI